MTSSPVGRVGIDIARSRVGIDIGGTFTDLVATTPDGLVVLKVSSTPSDPSAAFAEALGRLDGEVDEIMHGTTVATNAVITRSGPDLGFVTTRGFRHLLHLARQDRPSLYDLSVTRPSPLVDVARCVGVAERIGPDGAVIEALDEDDVRRQLATLEGVGAIAVTTLHAYANPSHERRIAELAGEVLGEVTVSISSDVLPEFREYERASTTAMNAYVQPVMEAYLRRISDRSGSGARVAVMWSGGGIRDIAHTIERPVHTMLSGPAAGVLGAAWACRDCGYDDIVTVDMGGTSADVALVDAGRPEVAESASIDGLAFRTPSLDVVSVGAGGGSIAWIDEGGALRVGPASAGADPGPACYGRGGTEATVTDAQAVLGYLGGLAGGELEPDIAAAEAAVDGVAARAGLDRIATAQGIIRIVRATMARAIRSVSVERGKDVRSYALVAFGGAGPLHATALARELGMSTVIVPPAPGALAALGLLVAPRRADASVSRPMIADPANDGELRAILAGLEEVVRRDLASEGLAEPDIERQVDMRYEGQSHELRIDVRDAGSFAALGADFEATHETRFGSRRAGTPVEAVTFRVAAVGAAGSVQLARLADDRTPRPVGRRTVEGTDVDVLRRADLAAGTVVEGPAILFELDSTTWIDRGSTATVADNGSLVIEVT